MDVKSLMTTQIIAVRPDNTVADAARIMLANRVSGLPVLDPAGKLVGVITEGDLLRRAELGTEGKQPGWLKAFLIPSSAAADYVATHGRHVDEVMTRNPLWVTPETELAEAANLMLKRHIKRLPVLDKLKLTGVISRSDLLRLLARRLIAQPADCTDEAITAYIIHEIRHARWAPRSGIKIGVKDKIVNVEGTIFSDEERAAIICIAENAPGVKDVQDHLTYVDPGSGLAFPAA